MTKQKAKQVKICPNCNSPMEKKGWVHEVDKREYFEYFCDPCVHIELVEVRKDD